MKTYFVRPGQNHNSRALLEALRHAVIEREMIQEYDTVFALSYDREDQFFVKTSETIYWGRLFTASAGYKDVTELSREMQKLMQTFNLPVKSFVFFPELVSGHGLLKALPGKPSCYEFSFLRSEAGSALALKELHVSAARVQPPADQAEAPLPPAPRSAASMRLSRSEIAELMDLSLQLKRLTE